MFCTRHRIHTVRNDCAYEGIIAELDEATSRDKLQMFKRVENAFQIVTADQQGLPKFWDGIFKICVRHTDTGLLSFPVVSSSSKIFTRLIAATFFPPNLFTLSSRVSAFSANGMHSRSCPYLSKVGEKSMEPRVLSTTLSGSAVQLRALRHR